MMASRLVSYSAGTLIGAGAVIASALAMPDAAGALSLDGFAWLADNLGLSTPFFVLVMVLYAANLGRLWELVAEGAPLRQVAQLDQLSDVWIHLFIGIGVVWTAIGMRSALTTTLDESMVSAGDAGHVLGSLVDGGILLALTSTIVGAVGGYLMRLGKTVLLGAPLTDYYHGEERRDIALALARLDDIERHLASISSMASTGTDHAPAPQVVR